jgi:uncharacterized membrane protein
MNAFVTQNAWKFLFRNSLPLSVCTHKGRRESSSWNWDRNAEVIAGPFFVFTGTRCRYFEKTSITDRMYLCIPLYFARDWTSNKSHAQTSMRFDTV